MTEKMTQCHKKSVDIWWGKMAPLHLGNLTVTLAFYDRKNDIVPQKSVDLVGQNCTAAYRKSVQDTTYKRT
jgi:hypothetical protein